MPKNSKEITFKEFNRRVWSDVAQEFSWEYRDEVVKKIWPYYNSLNDMDRTCVKKWILENIIQYPFKFDDLPYEEIVEAANTAMRIYRDHSIGLTFYSKEYDEWEAQCKQGKV